jgi:signal transduction histidine kinase
LFKEFYTSNGTSNESGTGLGLMLCKEFLIKNDGTIAVKSQEGKGSRFTFTLPVVEEE